MENVVFIIGFTYIGLFVFIILFDIIAYNKQNNLEKRVLSKAKKLYSEANRFLDFINKKNTSFEKKYLVHLVRQLRFANNLVAFSKMLEKWNSNDCDRCNLYMRRIGPIFPILIRKYRHASGFAKRYLSYFLAKYDYDHFLGATRDVHNFLLEQCESKSFYSRENALRSFVRFGDVFGVIDAFIIWSKNNLVNNQQTITQILLNYKNDVTTFIDVLLIYFSAYNPAIRIGIWNYISLKSDDYKEIAHTYLYRDLKEYGVIFACLRYLKDHPYEPALSRILEIGNIAYENSDWGYVAAVANTLGKYPSEETKEFLIKAVSSPFYYARQNASSSLLMLDPAHAKDYVESTNDRMAMDMFHYKRLEMTLNKKENE